MVGINRHKVLPYLRSTKGRIFHVTFTKKDGTLREMTCLIKPPKPNPKRPAPAKLDNPYVLVWDIQKYKEFLKEGVENPKASDGAYRLVNLDTIIKFKIHGIEFIVED